MTEFVSYFLVAIYLKLLWLEQDSVIKTDFFFCLFVFVDGQSVLNDCLTLPDM
jgi:hypothetical protein